MENAPFIRGQGCNFIPYKGLYFTLYLFMTYSSKIYGQREGQGMVEGNIGRKFCLNEIHPKFPKNLKMNKGKL